MDPIAQARLITLLALVLLVCAVVVLRQPRARRIAQAWWAAAHRERLLMAAAVALTATGQAMLAFDAANSRPGLALIGLGAACFWAAWRQHRPAAEGEAQPLEPPSGSSENRAQGATVKSQTRGLSPWSGRIAGVALSVATIFWLGERVSPHFLEGFSVPNLVNMGAWPSYAEQLSLWLGAIALFFVSVAPKADFTALAHEVRASWRTAGGRRDWMLVTGCMVAALALRTAWLETTLPIVFGDESSFARQAATVSEGYLALLFAPAHLSHPWLHSAAMAPFVSLLGRTLTAERMFSALCGALTVPAVYLLARFLFDRRVAAPAAVFIAGWSLHVHFSRLSLNNIVDPLFGALAFAFLWRGLRRGDRLSYALAGAALGLSQYFYTGARLYPLVMLAFLALLALFRRQLVWGQRRGLAVLALSFMLTTWPANYFLATNGLPLTSRTPDVSILEPRADHGGLSPFEKMGRDGTLVPYMGNQLYNALLAFNYKTDNSRFYGGAVPMFLPVEAVAFLLGVMWALSRWRTPARLLLLLLTVSTVVAGGALLFSPPHFTRYLVAVPALVILFALGLVKPLEALAPRWRWRGALAVGLAGLLALGSTGYYFLHHVASMRAEFAPRAWQIHDVAQRIRALPRGAMAYVIHAGEFDLHAEEVVFYLAPQREVSYQHYEDLNWSFVGSLRPGYHAFFISPGLVSEVLPALQRLLPEGQVEAPPSALPRGQPFLMYRLYPY